MNKLLIKWISLSILILTSFLTDAQSPKKLMKAGKAALKIQQYDVAIKAFTDVISLKPNHLDAYTSRAQAYENSNKLIEAAEDFSKASELSPKNKMLSYHAGRLYYSLGKFLEAIHVLNHSIEADGSFMPSYLLKIDCLLEIKNYSEALATCNQALEVKKTAQNYFNHALVSEKLNNDSEAELDYKNSIKIDKLFKKSYVGLANVLSRQKKNDEALKFCNQVIMMYPSYTDAFYTRSSIYYLKSDLINAIADINKTIDLDPVNENYNFVRAGYYFEFKQFQNAIADYSKVIIWNKKNYMAYYKRAIIYEETKQIVEAVADYSIFIELTAGNSDLVEMIAKAKQKIYDLNAETVKPEITLNPKLFNNQSSIEVSLKTKNITIEGIIQDQNRLEFIKINDKEYTYNKSQNKVEFYSEIVIADLDKITIVASDIYHNVSSVSYKIIRTEIDPPKIDVLTPYTSDYNEIFLESDTTSVFLEGKLVDESLIEMVTIDGVEAKFYHDKKNPNFSATIDIAGKTNIKIKAVDIYGNITEKSYKLNRETARILSENPMGKTWVIFIDNSDYETFASLEGPSKDITTMRSAFSKYDIHNIIEKKNMTKHQLEKFFSIDLRDMVKNQKVNSLLIWYAGHGKFINETGYWIPIDAKRDEEFTYFNINNLKSSMLSYTNYVTHVLVVSDACESGPSFYAAMRGAKKRECGDYTPAKFKSSQVFSSAGYELAADNSPFTKTFAKSLDYNTNSCIAIDDIVLTISDTFGQEAKQSPKFGKIQGLNDEDGTFYFMKK